MRQVAIMAILLSGCCSSWIKGKCCPAELPPRIVKVTTACILPTPPELPPAARLASGCPDGVACYDVANAKLIALREARLKQFVREALAACSKE